MQQAATRQRKEDRPSYAVGASVVPLKAETIGARLDCTSREFGSNLALVSRHQNVRLTYQQLSEQVDEVARALMGLGVQLGQRVGLWSSNCAEWVVVQYAVARIGGILVPINPAYLARELEHALRRAGITVLVAASHFRDRDAGALIDDLAPAGLADLANVVYLGAKRSTRGIGWDDFLAMSDRTTVPDLRAREALVQFDAPAMILFTSGTTGSPKGATLSHHSLLNSAFFIGERLRYGAADRVCLNVPLYHSFGCILGDLAALTHASSIILPSETFEPGPCLSAVEDEGCTSLYGVPTMFAALLADPTTPSRRLDSLRTGVMAGSLCPLELMREVVDRLHMPEVTICYGMTEAGTLCQSWCDDSLERRAQTVGGVHPWIECKITDPSTGVVVGRGVPGELCARGYAAMSHYWGDMDATRAAIDQGRWLRTGDLAVMDDDDYIRIVGRLKDLVIRGGENIDPREIEEVLNQHDKIANAYIVGVPDAVYGEELCACIRLREGQLATVQEIRRYCRQRLATSKIPRYVQFVGDVPMTATGKIQRFRLREMALATLSSQRSSHRRSTG